MTSLSRCSCRGRGTTRGHDSGREIVTICGVCQGTGRMPLVCTCGRYFAGWNAAKDHIVDSSGFHEVTRTPVDA